MKEYNGEKLVITRFFDAPVKAVWKAWTDENEAKKWWGPKNFTCPFFSIDLKVGGKNLSCMKSPEGKEYWGRGIYEEIVPFEKLVTTDSFSDEKGNPVPPSYYGMASDYLLELLITVTFEKDGNKTKITLQHEGFPEVDDTEQTRQGWNESFDKLAESLNR